MAKVAYADLSAAFDFVSYGAPLEHQAFVSQERLPHRLAVIEGFFRRRGAYARLKDLLASEHCLDAWYAYEADATERALRDWCRAHEIELDDE